MEMFDSNPLSQKIWEAHLLDGFKPHSLAKCDGRRDPYKHVACINMHMAFIGVPDSLK